MSKQQQTLAYMLSLKRGGQVNIGKLPVPLLVLLLLLGVLLAVGVPLFYGPVPC